MASYTILTRNGIADPGQELLLEKLSAELDRPNAKLLLHLHGGLVTEAAGREGAARLSGASESSWQLGDEWTQVYIVWRTGAFETIRINWTELATDDRLYRALIRKLIGFVARKIGVPDAGGRGAAAGVLSDEEILACLTGKRDLRAPFETIDGQLPEEDGTRAVLLGEQSNAELMREFEHELAGDLAYQAAVADLDEAINVPSGARSPSLGADLIAGERMRARLDEKIRRELEPPLLDAARNQRGIVSTGVFILTHAGDIALRCFRRFRTGRDHGLHATIVEEVAREFYGDLIGARVWGMMVKDAADHFGSGKLGSALLDTLKAKPPENIVITAHSAGSIWAARLLLAMKAEGVTSKVKLFLLAPAIRHDLFAEMIDKAGDLIGRCRMITMSDTLERRDAVLGHDKGYIYPSSLLYLVSGMFEERNSKAYLDAPLVGMQRFNNVAWLQQDEAQVAARIAAFFQREDCGILTSPTPGVSMADSHGAFDEEALTLASARALF